MSNLNLKPVQLCVHGMASCGFSSLGQDYLRGVHADYRQWSMTCLFSVITLLISLDGHATSFILARILKKPGVLALILP